MANNKAAEDGYAALKAFDSVYLDFLNAVANETNLAYGKCYRNLKEVRRLAGKLSDTFKAEWSPFAFFGSSLSSL